MSVFLFILAVILFFISYRNYKKTKNIVIDNQKQLQERDQLIKLNKKFATEKKYLEQSIEQLNLEIKNLEQDRTNALNDLNKTKEITSQEYEDKKRLVEEGLETYKTNTGYAAAQYIYSLEKQYQIAENDYKEKIKAIEAEIEDKNKELEKIKSTLSASQEAQLREIEKEQKEKFYQIQIDDISLKEIDIISEIEHLLVDPRPIRMLIWTTYYSKKFIEMCSRVVGTEDKCGIYKITDTVTKQIYVGQARKIKDRFRDHCKCGLGIDTPANNKLYAAMKKDGLTNFTFEVLEACSPEELDEKERFYIELYKSYYYGFNSNKGNSK